MDKIPTEIKEKILKFIEAASKYDIEFSDVILFGSYAKGNYHEYSDIDLALVSDNFEGIRFYDNMKLSDALIESSTTIETHPFVKADFNPEIPFVKEIINTGIKVI
jgi:predicted nucleotidyltransferase